MFEYLNDYKGDADAGSLDIPADKTVRLPDNPCRFVMLSNLTVTDAAALTTPKNAALSSQPKDAADNTELYWGIDGRISGQLFAGESTVLLPVKNTNKISIRAAAGATGRVHYTWFR
jgi:hypothetical protein